MAVPKPTEAMRMLDAQERFADYEFRNDLEKALLLAQNRQHEAFVRNFLLEMERLYPGSGFTQVGLGFFNTDVPTAVTFYSPRDRSAAIGLDYGSISIFPITFSAMLHAKLHQLDSLEWIEALLDIMQIQLLEDDGSSRARVQQRMQREQALAAASSGAIEATFRFLVAHELGHIYLGHFEHRKATPLSAVGTGGPADLSSMFEHEVELEADAWAASSLRQLAAPDALSQVLAAYVPPLYFGVLALAKEIYVPRTPLAQHMMHSHPDARLRAQRLLPPQTRQVRSADPVVSAIPELPALVVAELANPAFVAAAAHLKRDILAQRASAVRPDRPWWKFWA